MNASGQTNKIQVEELVAQAQGGDEAAFEALVAQFSTRIYNYVARMVQDPTEAQDVAQETFVRAYQAIKNFRGASSFQTWLYRIASNLAIDAARRRKRRQWDVVSLDEPVEGDEDSEMGRDFPDDKTRTPAEEAESAETRRQVWEAIGELSDKLRPVIILYDLQGLSYEEVAHVLGCPMGTVKSRLFNARSQLREKLKARMLLEQAAEAASPTEEQVSDEMPRV
jgi:RNA polymerase sigma-70 factor (ECF subfamily)